MQPQTPHRPMDRWKALLETRRLHIGFACIRALPDPRLGDLLHVSGWPQPFFCRTLGAVLTKRGNQRGAWLTGTGPGTTLVRIGFKRKLITAQMLHLGNSHKKLAKFAYQ